MWTPERRRYSRAWPAIVERADLPIGADLVIALGGDVPCSRRRRRLPRPHDVDLAVNFEVARLPDGGLRGGDLRVARCHPERPRRVRRAHDGAVTGGTGARRRTWRSTTWCSRGPSCCNIELAGRWTIGCGRRQGRGLIRADANRVDRPRQPRGRRTAIVVSVDGARSSRRSRHDADLQPADRDSAERGSAGLFGGQQCRRYPRDD